jgi:nucleotide-binding universal stress UspA family protein
MFRNVAVAVADLETGADAIELAKRLSAENAHLTLGHVYPGDERLWRGSSAEYDAVERQRGAELLDSVRQAAGIEAGMRVVGAASVGSGLHKIADSSGADLLVVGSSRRGLIGRVLLGDDTREALNGAPCAVAIAPQGYAQRTAHISEIGVGYNGSVESKHALEVARALAAEWGVKASAFETVSLPSYMFAGGMVPIDEPLDDLVAQARARLEALGIEGHAAYGRPSEELALYSASLDLLVVGSRDFGPVGRIVHGSTTHQLARMARCPLLVLTRAARHAAVTEPASGDSRPLALA